MLGIAFVVFRSPTQTMANPPSDNAAADEERWLRDVISFTWNSEPILSRSRRTRASGGNVGPDLAVHPNRRRRRLPGTFGG